MVAVDDLGSPELTEALAVLDARRRLHMGLRRCADRVRVLSLSGAVAGGDRPVDRRFDRALRDRRLLAGMQGDLKLATQRLRRQARGTRIEGLVAAVPLAPLQRDVLIDRLRGESWPRIAASRTRGDRGTAVRAFRQAVARVEATASVLEAGRREPAATAAAVARSTGLTVRTVNLIRRHLAAMASAGQGVGAAAGVVGVPQPARRRRCEAVGAGERFAVRVRVEEGDRPRAGALPCGRAAVRAPADARSGSLGRVGGVGGVGERRVEYRSGSGKRGSAAWEMANEPNPGGLAELCSPPASSGDPWQAAWRVLAVRPSAELSVKVALEQALGDRVRCRAPRMGRAAAGGYLAVSCTDMEALRMALTGITGVRGWVGGHRGQDIDGASVGVAEASLDPHELAAAWLNPRRRLP